MGAAAGSWAGTVLVLVTLKTKGSQGLAACRTAPSAVSNVANSRPRGGRPPWALWRLHKWLRGVLGGGRNQACAVALSSMRGCPHWLRTACFRPWTQLLPPALNLSLKSVSHQGYRAVPRSLSRGPGRPSSSTPARPTVASLRPPHADPAQLPAPAFMSFKLGRGGDWSCPELVGAMGPEGGAARPKSHGVPGSRHLRLKCLGLESRGTTGQTTCLLVPADVHCGGPEWQVGLVVNRLCHLLALDAGPDLVPS